MFDFLPIRLDVSIPQGVTLNRTIWNVRTGAGTVIDLSNATGVCNLTTSPMIWQNATPTMYTISVATDLNGAISLVASSNAMALIPAGNFAYNVILTDLSDNTTIQALYGVMQIEPAVMAGLPPIVQDGEANSAPITNE